MTELHFDSLAALAAEAEAQKVPISAVVLAAQARSTERSQQALYEQMRQNLAVMRESVRQGLAPGVKSASGLSGGDAHRMAAAFAGVPIQYEAEQIKQRETQPTLNMELGVTL